jgi:hypothetical protein
MVQITIAKLRGSLKKPSLAESMIQGRAVAPGTGDVAHGSGPCCFNRPDL